ncbi:MAG: HAMP domain-containing protein, partial [Pirellulaceae bacterium]|nr:HAMP domain-containing protein [Pirellulaceae bacterium]
MLSRWPIRYKLLLGITALVIVCTLLVFSSVGGSYNYRGLVRSLSSRASELPYASKLTQHINELRITLSRTQEQARFLEEMEPTSIDHILLRQIFDNHLYEVQINLDLYERELQSTEEAKLNINDNRIERETVNQMRPLLKEIVKNSRQQEWYLQEMEIEALGNDLDELQTLAYKLPVNLHQKMHTLAGEVRTQYRTWIIINWSTSVAAVVILILLGRQFWIWIFSPLRMLILGTRQVVAGNYSYRIRLRSHDEMAELADAMNAMTEEFQETKNNLDAQVRQRTKEVVRSEQLASVGFLAAGVAHEINNPLACIAWSAEALESRVAEWKEKV